MKVLIVTNVYLRKALNQGQASFVRDQISTITKYYPDVEFTNYTIRGRESKLAYLKSIFEVRDLIHNGNFDIVHIHYGFSGLFLLFMNPNIPILATLHGGDIQIEQGKKFQVWITKRVISKCNFVISLNERMKKIVSNYCKKTDIVPISVDMDFFTPSDHPREIENNEVRIIFPGSINRTVKNHPLFVETISILESQYHYKVNEIDFNNISRDEVKAHYQNCDLLLLTSISEGSPGVIKEAMSCNLPIVSTNVGDVAINLQNVENCAVASNFDAKELAFLANKCLKHQIQGKCGRDKLIELGYDDESICKKIYNIYNQLLKR